MKRTARFTALLMALLLVLGALAQGAGAEDIDYTNGTPWPDIDLDGVVTEDTYADIKDNFVLAVNKDAILATEIPEGYPYGGIVIECVQKQAEDLKNLFQGDRPEDHDTGLAYDLYQLMMDWDSRNATGVAPLKAAVDQVEAIDSLEALRAYYLETPVEDQLNSLWNANTIIGYDDANHYIISIEPCGLSLGDAAEYANLTSYGAMIKEANGVLAQKMLVKLGYTEDEANQKIDNCLALETLLAPAVPTAEAKGQAGFIASTNNHVTHDELQQAEGQLPILEQLSFVGYPEADDYLVAVPDYLPLANQVYTEENLPLIRDYMIVNAVMSEAKNLDRECYEWANDNKNAITGSSGMLPDETVFSARVSDILPWPVAQLYTQTYLKAEDKARIASVIEELRDIYHDILNEADFLSDATRAKAIEKLEGIIPNVLYPDSWEPYACDDLEFDAPAAGGTLWEALRSIYRYKAAKKAKDYSQPVDKGLWDEPPQTINCFYDPQRNAITIMGAFAQAGLYNSDMSQEEVYGKIGYVIGHEISHAFDREGAQFDKDGDMANWWADEDYAAFQQRNQKMIDYFNAMHPWQGQDFRGGTMTGEASADMAGFKAVLKIAATKEDFDYDALFRAFANIWLTKETLQRTYVHIYDVHPLNYLRINCTLQQYDEFLDFYGIKEGDGMYLAPEDRVAIW